MRILHVENDTAAARAAESMLKGVAEGYERTALGENAVKLASSGDYDLIVMELLLPDIDGQEVIRRIRANAVQTPVMVLSWLVDGDGAFDAAALGAIDALAKPFTKESLVGCIRSAMAKSGLSYPVQGDPTAAAGAPYLPAGVERREHRRFATDRPARIMQGPGIDCRIVELSYSAAKLLLLENIIDLPSSFQLVLADDMRFTCQVSRREGRYLGVKLLGRTG